MPICLQPPAPHHNENLYAISLLYGLLSNLPPGLSFWSLLLCRISQGRLAGLCISSSLIRLPCIRFQERTQSFHNFLREGLPWGLLSTSTIKHVHNPCPLPCN